MRDESYEALHARYVTAVAAVEAATVDARRARPGTLWWAVAVARLHQSEAELGRAEGAVEAAIRDMGEREDATL